MIFKFDCAFCGTAVETKRNAAQIRRAGGRPPRFCSQACNGASRRGTGPGREVTHEFDCAQCGKHCAVYRPPSAPTPRFCSLQCTGLAQQGEGNPSFTGGRHVGSNGYVFVLASEHPNADPRGYVYEHRLVMERQTGRLLSPGEVVHHVNRVKTDNRPENLMLLSTQSEHLRLHHEENRHAR